MGLSRYDYLQTKEGQENLYLRRKLRGRFHFSLDIEPRSKNAMSKSNKIVLQQALLEQMRTMKRRLYRSRIAVNIYLDAADYNPPWVHTTVKNLLDLFSVPLSEIGTKRQKLLYSDDSQIAYLGVRYFKKSNTGSIYVKTAPFADFLADLHLVNLHELKGDDEERLSQNHSCSDDLDDYYGLIQKKSAVVKLLSEEEYDGLLKMHKMSIQQHLLNLPRLKLQEVSWLYKYSIDKRFLDPELRKLKNDSLSDIYHQLNDMIYNFPIRLKLPRVPLRSGDTRDFKISVRKILREYKNKFRFFDQAKIPVFLEVLYQPPCEHKGFVKDLDNIMRIIIPFVYEELKPPPEIEGYEIFELPREVETPKDGFLVMGITSAWDSIETLWGRMDNAIEKWLEERT